ncbi:FAD-binding protein, partial [Candidatus Bathyarchaeota archaeon]|nr:FAD-binding protein [Candidatus Bathyarchaeota archaeon]
VKWANLHGVPLLPVSSQEGLRIHGDSVPNTEGQLIVDLSPWQKIHHVDAKNRSVLLQPGVTFQQLIPRLKKKGLRPLMPLLPRAGKSVLSSGLEREPITIPRYHWDMGDPILCMGVIFGTGDRFRTGSAAGPGTLKHQRKSGQAHLVPMGPTQFSPGQLIQGAQGSLGIVTWATIKCEYMPDETKIYHVQSSNVTSLIEIQHLLLKYRYCDEIFIMDDKNLASLLADDNSNPQGLSKQIQPWNLIFRTSGRGNLAERRVKYIHDDIIELVSPITEMETLNSAPVDYRELERVLETTAPDQWRARWAGNFLDIFFLAKQDSLEKYVKIAQDFKDMIDMGFYFQPVNLGTSIHCEIDLYHGKSPEIAHEKLIDIHDSLVDRCLKAGAFFSRPYLLTAKQVFSACDVKNVKLLNKIKQLFDPMGILNPGVLCFDDFFQERR